MGNNAPSSFEENIMAKSRPVRITIEVPSNHTMEVPKGTEDMVAELFEAAGLTGDFTLYLGEFVKGTAHIQGVSVRSLVDRRVIKIRVQPGSNTTSQMLKMMVPEGQNAQEFFARLQRAEQQMAVESKSERLKKKMRRLYRAVRGRDFSIAEVPQETIDELDFDSPDALNRTLQNLVRTNFILMSGSEPSSYAWRGSFHEQMELAGYDPEQEAKREKVVPKENESEEDKALSAVLEAEEEIQSLEDHLLELQCEALGVEEALRPAVDEFNALMRQLEDKNAKVEQLRKEETAVNKRVAEARTRKEILERRRHDLNDKLSQIDRERKLDDVRKRARALFADLPPEDRARLINELAPANPNQPAEQPT